MTTFHADDFAVLNTTYVPGSGYGVALAEHWEGPDKFYVLLVNEEGLPLSILRVFRLPARNVDEFVVSVQSAIEHGKGERFQKLGTEIES